MFLNFFESDRVTLVVNGFAESFALLRFAFCRQKFSVLIDCRTNSFFLRCVVQRVENILFAFFGERFYAFIKNDVKTGLLAFSIFELYAVFQPVITFDRLGNTRLDLIDFGKKIVVGDLLTWLKPLTAEFNMFRFFFYFFCCLHFRFCFYKTEFFRIKLECKFFNIPLIFRLLFIRHFIGFRQEVREVIIFIVWIIELVDTRFHITCGNTPSFYVLAKLFNILLFLLFEFGDFFASRNVENLYLIFKLDLFCFVDFFVSAGNVCVCNAFVDFCELVLYVKDRLVEILVRFEICTFWKFRVKLSKFLLVCIECLSIFLCRFIDYNVDIFVRFVGFDIRLQFVNLFGVARFGGFFKLFFSVNDLVLFLLNKAVDIFFSVGQNAFERLIGWIVLFGVLCHQNLACCLLGDFKEFVVSKRRFLVELFCDILIQLRFA